MIKNADIDIIVNVPRKPQSVADSETILKEALKHRVPYFTTVAAARAMCTAFDESEVPKPYRLQRLHENAAG